VSTSPQLLHLDEHVLVMNKPSGLAVHPGWVPRTEKTALVWARREAGCHVYPAHRLDRATSGVLVFGLSSAAARVLGGAFTEGRVHKRYIALVRGTPPDEVDIDHPVPRSEDGPRVPAQTWCRKLARSPKDRCSLVEAQPKTGRLHQIRRHLKHLSHPLVGDVRYGKGDINRHYRAQWSLHRLALHALELEFPHPSGEGPLRIYAPVPEDLAEPLNKLELGAFVPSATARTPEA
jgi:tRNA pseudouridine65 synthase